jgi:hypothetical protein
MRGPKGEDSLARDDHAPVTDDPHNCNFRQQDQRMTVVTTEGRVSPIIQLKCVDLASKNINEDENLAMHHANDMDQISLSPIGCLEDEPSNLNKRR